MTRTGKQPSPLARRVQLLMLGRVAFITLVLGATLWLGARPQPQVGVGTQTYLLSGLVVATYLLTILYGFWLRRDWGLQPLATAQVLVDIALAGGFTWATGGPESNLTFLYLLAAIGASQTVSRRQALATATLAASSLATLWLLEFNGVIAHALVPAADRSTDGDILALNLSLNVLALYAVTFLGSLLFEQARAVGERLEETQADLAALGQLHGNIVTSLQSGLITLDGDRHITFTNPAASRILGRPIADINGRTVLELLPELEIDSEGRSEVIYERMPGETLQLGLQLTPLHDADGTQSGSIVIFTDLTTLRSTQQALERAERFATIGRVAAQMAHEIRNPLTAISGAVDMLAGDVARDEEAAQLTTILQRETNRLDSLLTQILDYARPRDPVRVKIDLVSLVREAVAVAENDRSLEDRTLELSLPDEEVGIDAEPDEVKQALWNLLRNAIQVTPSAGTVTVLARRDRDHGILEVQDQGPGVSAADREGIFEPFYTTKRGGSGIGLAVVRRIAESHGGSVLVQDAPGGGAAFILYLPLAPQELTTGDGAGAALLSW